MATYSNLVLTFDCSVTGNFQTLHSAVDVQLQGLGGWTYDAQTGDGDPAAATAPSADATACFRVYTTTISGVTWYLRIDFGRAASNNGPMWKIQLGSGVNGSGTLTGQVGTQQKVATNGSSGSRSLYMSVATGRFMLFAGPASDLNGSNATGWSIHVDVDATGANTTTGIQLIGFTSGPTWFSQTLPASGTVPAALTLVPMATNNATSNVVGSHTMVFCPILYTESGGLNPVPAIIAVGSADSTVVTTMTVNIYSVSRTYLVTGATSPNGLSTNNRSAFLYD
jgi:hypothetical protein